MVKLGISIMRFSLRLGIFILANLSYQLGFGADNMPDFNQSFPEPNSYSLNKPHSPVKTISSPTTPTHQTINKVLIPAVGSLDYNAGSYAHDMGISFTEAKYRLNMMGSSHLLGSRIREYFGDDFTGQYYGLDEHGNFGLNIRTVRPAPLSIADKKFIKDIFDETKIPINIVFNARLNEKQLNALINTQGHIAYQLLPDIQTISYNVEKDVIAVGIYRKNLVTAGELAMLRKQLIDIFGYSVSITLLGTPLHY